MSSADHSPTSHSPSPRSRGRGVGPFSGGQLTVIVVALMVVLGLPLGANAVVRASSDVITDAHARNHAAVDASGGLSVTGPPPASTIVAGNVLSGPDATLCGVAVPPVSRKLSNSAHRHQVAPAHLLECRVWSISHLNGWEVNSGSVFARKFGVVGGHVDRPIRVGERVVNVVPGIGASFGDVVVPLPSHTAHSLDPQPHGHSGDHARGGQHKGPVGV
jgi:hypothetical protein